jgi:hypothetical protein|tara:strand:- start:6216 stop:6563 length:348 start_codon:yes stop_codon:yes gene_type:complete
MAGRKKDIHKHDDYADLLKTFAQDYWDSEVGQAHELFKEPYPSLDDPHRVKKITFLDNSKRAKLQMLKHLATSLSGVSKPLNELSGDEKKQSESLLKQAMERIAKGDNKDKKADE